MTYKNIFIDLDDTLVDTSGNAKIALKQMYDLHKIDRYYSTFEKFATPYFAHNNYLWELFSQGKLEKDELLFDRFYNPFKDFENVSLDWINKVNNDYSHCVETIDGVVDGTHETLDYLRDKYKKLYVLSNGFAEAQKRKMRSAKLEGYFERCFYSDVIGANKPHPDFYNHVLRETGLRAEDSVMIGDNIVTDIGGANGVGIASIWLNPDHKDNKGIKPIYTIAKLEEIRNIL